MGYFYVKKVYSIKYMEMRKNESDISGRYAE